jgi:predicted dehydrogenase
MIKTEIAKSVTAQNKVVRWAVIGSPKEAQQKSGLLFGVSASNFIDNPDTDAVYIATPPGHHLEYALKVCGARKPCLIEAPGGRSSEEWERISSAFSSAGVPLFISFYKRFLPKFIQVRKILESGKLGFVASIQYRHASRGVNDNWKVEPKKSGGGLFWSLGGHILDLFEFWFGPLELLGGGAANLKDSYPVEDVVSISFRTKNGALGSALWDFTAKSEDDLLIIQGSLGWLSLSCEDPWSPCVIEMYPQTIFQSKKRTLKNRILNKLKNTLPSAITEPKNKKSIYSFSKLPYEYGPMVASIMGGMLERSSDPQGAAATTPESALRTFRIMDSVLSDYYAGRRGPYWDRSSTWKSRQNRPLSRFEEIVDSIQDPAHRLSREEVAAFLENGYLGPFACEAPEVRSLSEQPIPKNTKEHLHDPRVRSICSHPSVVSRISQLLNSKDIKLFKPRFVNKLPQAPDGKNLTFPWHQDVGDNNGGYRRDGSPVPTVSVWLSISGATASSGPVLVMPGSHRRFYGNWRQYIHAKIEDDARVMSEINESQTRPFITKPGEFYIFHSWVLHSSGLNASSHPRSALNMRFMSADEQVEPCFEYITLSAS